MAIKISGNTVIDDNPNITATGSATIDGPISLGKRKSAFWQVE